MRISSIMPRFDQLFRGVQFKSEAPPMTFFAIGISICVFFAWLRSHRSRRVLTFLAALAAASLSASVALAQQPDRVHEVGGEANLKLPDLAQGSFLGIDGHTLLVNGLVVCFLGLV